MFTNSLSARMTALGAAFLIGAGSLWAGHRVIKDDSRTLVIMLEPDNIRHSESKGELTVSCDNCISSGLPGSADLPYIPVNIICNDLPGIQIKTLGATGHASRYSIKPVPRHEGPVRQIFKKDASLFQRAGSPRAIVGPVQRVRNIPTRTVLIPMATWDERAKRLNLIDSARVEITFSTGEPAVPARGRVNMPHSMLRDYFNPAGGAGLSNALTRPHTRSQKISRRATVNLNKDLIKVRVGDRNSESISEDGIYKIEFETLRDFMENTGRGQMIMGNTVNSIRMYTGGEKKLSETMAPLPGPGNLEEIPVEVIDRDEDGTFDDGDYILFFGHGTGVYSRVNWDSSALYPIHYEFKSNPYSYYNYYYLDFAGSGMRLSELPVVAGSASSVSSSYSYHRKEKDLLLGTCDPSGRLDTETGRNWYWVIVNDEICSNSSLTTINLPASQMNYSKSMLEGYRNGRDTYFGMYVYNQHVSDTYEVSFGGTLADVLVGSLPFEGQYYRWSENLNDEAFNIRWTGSRTHLGFDGYTVVYNRSLEYPGHSFYIYPEDFENVITYETSSGVKILRIKDGKAEGEIKLNGNSFTDRVQGEKTVKYFVSKTSDEKNISEDDLSFEVKAPSGVLQNIVAGDGRLPDYLIVTHDSLVPQALELKKYREGLSSMDIQVVRTQDIFRQYSSGRESPVAIRDFIRHVYAGYKPSADPDSTLKYVLLFGDGYYDYRNIHAVLKDPGVDLSTLEPNYVPPYERTQFSSDDFFAYLDFGEEMHTAGPGIDLAVGRVPVSSDIEAAAYLDKIKAYNDPAQFGPWRNIVIATADDDFQRDAKNCNIDPISQGHTNDARDISEIVLREEPGKILDNIYLLNYEHNYANAKPDAAQDLLNKINRGALTINYIGHGDSHVWADEGLLVTNKALPKMTNSGKNAVFSSFSCTVGRFEKLSQDGLSESFMAAPDIGAIATVSATRESFVSPNISLAKLFYEHLFKRPADNSGITVGDALRNAKNIMGLNAVNSSFNFINREKYGLFGEPAVTIRKPYLDISVTGKPDSIRALDCGTFSGTVSGGSGRGFIHVDVFGQNSEDTAVGRVCPPPSNRATRDQYMDVNGPLLFSSTVPYENGKFSMDYIFNERIPFGDSAAYIKFYAWDSDKPAEGTTLLSNLPVGGAADNCDVSNKTGPSILISGCDREQTSMVDFESAIKIPIPYCLEIIVIDSSGGVFITNRPDEGTTVEVWNLDAEGQESPPEQPRLSEDSFSRKSFTWEFDNNWSPGKYLLKVRAQDGFGNLSVRNIDVELVENDFLNVYRVYNAPNPLKDKGTCFYFGGIGKANVGTFVEEDANFRADIKIYNQNGYLVRHMRDVGARGSFDETLGECKNRSAWWDGRNTWGKKLGNGFYYYKVFVRQNFSTSTGNEDRLSTRKNTLLISR